MVKKRFAAGFDVGGTKCAVILGELTGEGLKSLPRNGLQPRTSALRKPALRKCAVCWK